MGARRGRSGSGCGGGPLRIFAMLMLRVPSRCTDEEENVGSEEAHAGGAGLEDVDKGATARSINEPEGEGANAEASEGEARGPTSPQGRVPTPEVPTPHAPHHLGSEKRRQSF